MEIAHDRRCAAQIADRLEQRDDKQRRRRARVAEHAAHQRAFLLQEQHLEQVADRLGVADNVVADTVRAEQGAQITRGVEHRKLALGAIRIGNAGNAQRTRVAQQAEQQGLLLGLVELCIVRRDTRRAQQFGNCFLVAVGALPKINRGEMEAEDLHRTAQRR